MNNLNFIISIIFAIRQHCGFNTIFCFFSWTKKKRFLVQRGKKQQVCDVVLNCSELLELNYFK